MLPTVDALIFPYVSATAGDDFQLLTNEVTLTPEQQQNTIRIKILEDSKFDPNDKFTVKIEVLNTDPRRPRITITEDTVDVEIACKGMIKHSWYDTTLVQTMIKNS